jgi:hypothetical protein
MMHVSFFMKDTDAGTEAGSGSGALLVDALDMKRHH